MSIDLSSWGTVYENQYGKFLAINGSITGIRADKCVPLQGTVTSCIQEEGTDTSPMGWYEIKVTDYPEPFEVHMNWVSIHGRPELGDVVRGLVDSQQHGRFWKLEKVPKEDLGV